jgi:hypothetical protein
VGDPKPYSLDRNRTVFLLFYFASTQSFKKSLSHTSLYPIQFTFSYTSHSKKHRIKREIKREMLNRVFLNAWGCFLLLLWGKWIYGRKNEILAISILL